MVLIFTDILFTSVLTKKFNEKTNYLQICIFNIRSAMLSEVFTYTG